MTLMKLSALMKREPLENLPNVAVLSNPFERIRCLPVIGVLVDTLLLPGRQIRKTNERMKRI